MLTLFIDTHFKDIHLCLYQGDKVLKIIEQENCASTSKTVLPLIRKMFNELHLKPNNIEKIIVCNGPGSFTGIRLAITIAKVFAYALSIPIYTINYLEVLALNNKSENTYGVIENNGYYKATFIDDKMVSSIEYIKSKNIENVKCDTSIDYNKIITYPYLKKTDCYNANPLYIKKIEVENVKTSHTN